MNFKELFRKLYNFPFHVNAFCFKIIVLQNKTTILRNSFALLSSQSLLYLGMWLTLLFFI